MSFVLDASAVLRYLDGEAGTDRVGDILDQHAFGTAEAIISAMHWGEVIGIFYKRHGIHEAESRIARLRALELTVAPVTGERAERGAKIKLQHRIPYVDALAVELAANTPECVLVTADFDMKPAESFLAIEFLPTKNKQ